MANGRATLNKDGQIMAFDGKQIDRGDRWRRGMAGHACLSPARSLSISLSLSNVCSVQCIGDAKKMKEERHATVREAAEYADCIELLHQRL